MSQSVQLVLLPAAYLAASLLHIWVPFGDGNAWHVFAAQELWHLSFSAVVASCRVAIAPIASRIDQSGNFFRLFANQPSWVMPMYLRDEVLREVQG
jgi:hypothetical protein